MSEYQPTSRRPIANPFRATARWAVTCCVRLHIHADVVSYASVVVSALAAVCFWQAGRWPLLLIIGPLLCYLRLWCNMLDGMVALAAGQASLRGEILNDLPDRLSDVLIFVGVAHSGLAAVVWGYWAAIMALLTAYVGTFGQAVGVRRQFGGMMSKPWRMVVLNAGAWLTYILLCSHAPNHYARLTVLDWTCVVIVLGCVQTIWVRLARITAELRSKAALEN